MKSIRARQVVAVIVVATALCADRATVTAAPLASAARTQSRAGNSLGRIVQRLSQGLRQDVRIDLPVQMVRSVNAPLARYSSIAFGRPTIRTALSPSQFPLPPPLV